MGHTAAHFVLLPNSIVNAENTKTPQKRAVFRKIHRQRLRRWIHSRNDCAQRRKKVAAKRILTRLRLERNGPANAKDVHVGGAFFFPPLVVDHEQASAG